MSAVEKVIVRDGGRARSISTLSASHIGQLLVDAGKLSKSDVRRVVQAQSEGTLRFGDAAVALGLVEARDVQDALSKQFTFPFVRPGSSGLAPELVAAYQPFSPHTEALRALRTQLALRWFHDKRNTLAVVGCQAQVGCTTLAANLAIVFAQLGENTLLIDANLRNPRQHRLFGLPEDNGLSMVLAGRRPFKEAPLLVEPFNNLWVLPAGPAAPNPQELLGRVGFNYVMETAPAAFDVIIVDTPPVLGFSDAQLIAAQTRACLMVTRRNQTSLADVEKAKQRLYPTGTAILGAVING